MANESGVAQNLHGDDNAAHRDGPAAKAQARCWKRGLHDECVRSQTGAVIVALGAVLVMLPATWPHAYPDWVPPAMLESALGLMAWIFLLITVSRRVEAKRVAKAISASSVAGGANSVAGEANSGTGDPLRSQLLVWAVVALPVPLCPLALFLLGARPQWGPNGSAIVDAGSGPQGNVKGFVFTLTALIVAMALFTWLLSRRIIRDADEAVATEEGNQSYPVFDRKPVAHRVGYDDPPPRLRGLTIACSGGGVRAAAFSLGGINAVQARGSDVDDPALGLSSIVAVSGGSYMAAAFALTCTYDDQGQRLVEVGKDQGKPLDFKDVYALRTPELTHIRRNSRYLYEPWWRTTATVLQLVAGAAVNVLVAVAALRFGAWFLGWLLPELGLLRLPFADPASEGPGWAAVDWLLKVGPWALPAAAVALALLVQFHRRSGRDNGERETPSLPTWAMAMARSAQAMLVGAALFVLVPGLIMGLGQLAYANAPTPAVANAIVAFGFTREKDCATALTTSADSMWQTIVDQRRLSAQDTSGPYGACGRTGTLRATAQDVVGPVGTTPALSGDQLQLISKQAGDTSRRGVLGQLTGVLTVLASALALIRQGTTKVPLGDNKTLAAVRRSFMVRLPLMAVVALALLLLLQWTYQISINNASRAEIGSWVLVLLAIYPLSMLDPNLTSMHEAYRERLSSAFAVGRGAEGGAAALPYKERYKLSELPARPELVICTTANINDQQVVPTRRFGVPMTFGRNEVRLEVADTDAAAGHLRTTDAENDGDSPTLSVMGAVAMSGAAVSPLMGRESAAGGPFRLLLTLFNVRLGVWLRNPRWPQSADHSPWSFIVRRPRLAMLFGEAAGATRVDSRWLYVTDGGHLDNTGLVEAARRSPDRVLVLDAGNDVAGSWEDLGSAVSVVRADLGIDLVVKDEDPDGTWILLAGEKPPARGGGILRVLSVKAALPTSDEGQAALPKDVMSFHKTHPSFPRASTGRQDFGDLEFEAYRRLGQYSVDRALAAVDAPDDSAL